MILINKISFTDSGPSNEWTKAKEMQWFGLRTLNLLTCNRGEEEGPAQCDCLSWFNHGDNLFQDYFRIYLQSLQNK